jgi:hypothetical protein
MLTGCFLFERQNFVDSHLSFAAAPCAISKQKEATPLTDF